MKTLHTAYRVSDLAASLGFYSTLGYAELGRVDIGEGATLTMQVGTGFSHLVVQVDDLAATVESLSRAGLSPGPVQRPGGPHGPQTSGLTDPDGYKIELVQWPRGHPDGITAADFA